MAGTREPLASLARNYPPGSRGLGTLVLREYTQIVAARQRGWAWKDIAGGMDLPETKAKALAEAFRRVHARVESGQLTAPKGTQATPAARTVPAVTSRPATASPNELFESLRIDK